MDPTNVGGTYYVVRAKNSAGFSAVSNTVTRTTPQPPNAPSSVTATLLANRTVRISWNDNSNNETGFEVLMPFYGPLAPGQWLYMVIATVGANVRTYTTPVGTRTTDPFSVRAINAVGASAVAGGVIATPGQ